MFKIDASQLEFYPIGADTGGTPESVLKGNVVIVDRAFHVEAIQVSDASDGGYTAANPQYYDTVEAIYTMADGSPLHAVNIDGRDYLLAIFPHS